MAACAMSMILKEEEAEQGRKGPTANGGWHKSSTQSHAFPSLAVAMPRAAKIQVGLCPAQAEGGGGGGYGWGEGKRQGSVQTLTLKSLATAIPRAAEMDVELCPAPKGSYSLSERLVKPDMPPVCLMVGMRDLLPVRILWG